MRTVLWAGGQEEEQEGLGELDLRRLRVWAFGALCTYREMNQVAGSKAGRCLLLTRTGHVRHPLLLLPHPCPYPPLFSSSRLETSLALRLWPETPPLSFAPRISRKSLSLSLSPLFFSLPISSSQSSRLSRVRINARSPAQTSRGNSRFRFRYYRRYLQVASSCSTPRFPRDRKAVVCPFDPLSRIRKRFKFEILVERNFPRAFGSSYDRQRVLHRRLQISGRHTLN